MPRYNETFFLDKLTTCYNECVQKLFVDSLYVVHSLCGYDNSILIVSFYNYTRFTCLLCLKHNSSLESFGSCCLYIVCLLVLVLKIVTTSASYHQKHSCHDKISFFQVKIIKSWANLCVCMYIVIVINV